MGVASYTLLGVAAHLLRDDGLVVLQDEPLDVMSPQLPLLHRLGLQAVEEESLEEAQEEQEEPEV